MSAMVYNECPECGARPGMAHRFGCDVELCPYCGDQLVRCRCPEPYPPLDDRLVWTGIFPGVAECVEFGWFGRLVPGQGWVTAHPGEPDAEPDLYRLHEEARWHREEKRFVLEHPLHLGRRQWPTD
jgi:hypothetical protein